MVAAYFAVAEDLGGDGAIYVLQIRDYLQLERNPDPWAVDRVAKVIPNHVSMRITAQAGLFTIHPRPNSPLTSSNVKKIVIPADSRREMKQQLSKIGVNEASMFPGLDGIARHIAWLRTDEE